MVCYGTPLCHFIIGVSGIILAVLGAVLGWVVFPNLVNDQVGETVAIVNNTGAYDRWEKLPLPMQYKIYIFHILNPIEITELGAKPAVQEVGPYIYTETRAKEKLEFHEDEDRASYYQKLHFEFDADASYPLTEDDVLTVVNVPALSFALITDSIPGLGSSLSSFNSSIYKMWNYTHPIFIEEKVGDYLFKGINMYCNQELTLENLDVYLMCIAYSLVSPPTVIISEHEEGINTFAFFKYKNDSYDGRYEVSLGINDPTQVGQIISWEGQQRVNKWGGDTCNTVQGTDSTIFRPKLDDGVDSLYIFNTDICRSIKLEYDSETSYKGIDGKRFVTKSSTFASVLDNEENYCFCPRSVQIEDEDLTEFGGCLKSGLLDLSSCQGAPVLLSHPHYLYADPSIQDMVVGLKPDVEKHLIHLDLETYTGTPLRGSSKVQMNAFLKRIKEVDLMAHFPNALIPILWIDEGVELNDELLDVLNSELFDILYILEVVRWVLIAAGIAVVIAGIAFFIYFRQKREQWREKKRNTLEVF